MDTLKIILIVIGVFALAVVAFWLVGIIISILWFLFWIGLVGALGYAGYKLFLQKEKETPKLDKQSPVAIAEMKDVDRALDEYKRKYLPEETKRQETKKLSD
jgi:hypothetical protein